MVSYAEDENVVSDTRAKLIQRLML